MVRICQELPTWSLGDEFHFPGDEFQPKNLIFFATLCEWIASETNQTLYLHGRGGEIRTHDLRYPKPSRYQAAPFVDDFTKRIVERVKAFKLGDPLNPTTDIGSMITKDFKEMG